MVAYGKKVIYLSCMENGDKVKSAGFIKVVNEKSKCSMDMHISGMKEMKEGRYDICVVDFEGMKHVLGKVYVHQGKGEWKQDYSDGQIEEHNKNNGKTEKTNLEYEDIEWFWIGLSDNKWLEGRSGNVKKAEKQEYKKEEHKKEEHKKQEQKKEEHKRVEYKKDTWEKGNDTKEDKKSKNTQTEAELKAGWAEEESVKTLSWTKKESSGENRDKSISSNEMNMENIILNDKWLQLCQMYPVIHPYEDDREYISIQPKDFVIMTGDYQHLANNSFLLHGFYNYRHIILGNEKEAGGFYLGVPGVYYEREKMVALMFGFEAFDCKGGKAEAGKFGYYLRKVKI